MAQNQPTRRRTPPPQVSSEIPDKLYFRIGEVARLCDVAAYVLRFWESEFPLLKPNKGGTGQRLFRRRDVETALRIKRLLYDEGYTIPGARQLLKSEARQKEPFLPLALTDPSTPGIDPQHLQKLQRDLRDLHTLLSKPATRPTRTPVQSIRPPRAAPRARNQQSADPLFDALTPSGPNAS